MTQLIIDGHEAVLPKNFSCTVKRENSFFTKSGEYTYDVTLRLDNQTNRELYDFLQRINKSDSYETNRTAVLIADGHVYCRGTEIVTRWTDETVTLQIVSGESELNYFIGQDKKMETLDMGSITGDIAAPFVADPDLKYPDIGYCLPTICEEGVSDSAGGINNTINYWSWYEDYDIDEQYYEIHKAIAQPYLCNVLRRLFMALGYNLGVFQLEDTQFKYLFFVNRKNTRNYAEMFAGWTVKDFLEEVEKLTNCCFLLNNKNKTVDVMMRHTFFMEATQFTIKNVIDAYETEVDVDEKNADISSSDIVYDFPDDGVYNLMRLPEVIDEHVEYRHYESFEAVRTALEATASSSRIIAIDDSTGRKYIRQCNRSSETQWAYSEDNRRFYLNYPLIMEVDTFEDLRRENGNGETVLQFTPAPMGTWLAGFEQYITEEGQYGETGRQHYLDNIVIPCIVIPSSDTATVEEDTDEGESNDIRDLIESADEPTEASQINLYVAFYNGLHGKFFGGTSAPIMIGTAYTDWESATIFYSKPNDNPYEGSLRTQQLDVDSFSNGYQIDTKHSITIETYDPNVIDPRQVYVIRNKRFVCRDVEEIITNEGRQAKWKGTFFPITITDDALEKRWVLTNGTWDDGAAWLDDGRWNDGPEDPQNQTPVVEPVVTPGTDPDSVFTSTIEAFDNVTIPADGVTYGHLLNMYNEAKSQFYDSQSLNSLPVLYKQNNFPMVYNYYGSVQQRQQAFQKMVAWIFAMTLAELAPAKRDAFYRKAYDFSGAGKQIPTYQHRFDSDTNVARLVGSAIWATMRDATKISSMRTEVGGSTISYSSSSYEVLVDTRPFMPQAPGPYLSTHDVNSRQGATPTYSESPGGYPVGDANTDHNLVKDQQIYDYVVSNYNLSSTNAELKQRTVQAIADKEYELPHLFGSSRTVTDPTYGTLTFNPVFGAHNLGVTINVTGAIATLISTVVPDCSRTRETLLHQQYGRRRPGQGTTDGSAKSNSQERALVNYTIEEGDGHSTGYYNQNGDYIKQSDNSHIGDYVDYFQRKLSANSYPSGHSAYIWGVALVLMEVMPDKADKIMKAANDFALSRVIARYHWMSDTIHGRVIGSVMVPVEHALTNVNYASLLAAAKAEYQALT